MNEIIIESKSCTKKVIILFHGYGADMNDLEPVGQILAKVSDDISVHLPNGIEACDCGGSGRQWFPFEGADVNALESAFRNSAPTILEYINDIKDKYKLEYSDIILAGFSQGAMIALGLGLQCQVLGIIAFSGLLLNLSACNKNISTKVLITYGGMDEVIPISAMHVTKDALESFGISVESVVSENMHHAIDNIVLNEAVNFVKKICNN